jgi:hypothetical protein
MHDIGLHAFLHSRLECSFLGELDLIAEQFSQVNLNSGDIQE